MTYHWTTKQNAIEIEKTGIHENSFFCQYAQHWYGEVCFEVIGDARLDIIWHWDYTNKDSWQRVNHALIEPEFLRRLNWFEILAARIVRRLGVQNANPNN